MALTTEQRRNINRALKVAARVGASPRERKALIEAMAVESNYRHLPYGDRDSVGVLQQRPSQGWGARGESVETDVRQFLEAAKRANTGRGSAGQLAQRVQRSAFPGRYHERSGEAEEILRGRTDKSRGGSTEPDTRSTTRTIAGVDRSGERRQLLAQYLLSRGDPDALLMAKAAVNQAQDTPSRTVTETTQGRPRARPTSSSSGGGVKGRGAGVEELFYDPVGGWDKGVSIGPIGGHEHVHVASRGPATMEAILREAQRRGLSIKENPLHDPVDPVHTGGSWHYQAKRSPKTGRKVGLAADISGSDAQERAFVAWIRRKFGLK